ncbi:hypothetical protein C8R43DRAFT_959162 [Mycena crocata]|nr:hypothetical protein C8R43DRAFT_959162 [Mycena crocata]
MSQNPPSSPDYYFDSVESPDPQLYPESPPHSPSLNLPSDSLIDAESCTQGQEEFNVAPDSQPSIQSSQQQIFRNFSATDNFPETGPFNNIFRQSDEAVPKTSKYWAFLHPSKKFRQTT